MLEPSGHMLQNYAASEHLFLMAEDNPIDAAMFSEMFCQAFGRSVQLVCVDRFDKIPEQLNTRQFDALILDLDLPDSSGIENIQKIKQPYPNLPIIVLTGNDDLSLALDSLQNGAQDYLSKNKVTPDLLTRSIFYAKERKQSELELKGALDDLYTKNIQLESLAKHDSLTGLANRSYFHDEANHILTRAKRHELKSALLYFDLNNFKKINDSYGHLAGDTLLKQTADRLRLVVRESDFIARLGGDEFVIITDILSHKEEVFPLIQRIEEQFNYPFEIGPHQLEMKPSIGIAFYPDADNLDALIKQADFAMYEAKKNKGNNICFYSEKIAQQHYRNKDIENHLIEAIEQGELFTAFQPIVSVQPGKPVHFEALARWKSKSLGNIRPDEFIPIAESTPLINSITQVMTRNTKLLLELSKHRRQPIGSISINVSARQLTCKNFGQTFLQWLDEQNIDSQHICLELTETQAIENYQQCLDQFMFLRSQGIKISLDDFGSGFASTNHLLDLPFDIIKLDKQLIRCIDKNTRGQALVAGTIEMAHRLNMTVIAEGMENFEERQTVIDLGCDYLQGFLIAKPLSLGAAASFSQCGPSQPFSRQS
ncbi:EAL domain-containing protein [Reinekea thalattae]|nr:EAL domain-containing protein [Reinekea thalattae]